MNRLALVLAVFIAVPAVAQTGVTGTWSGTYSFSVQVASCSNKTFNASGNASLTLLQTGSSVSGRLDLANFVAIDNSCNASTIEATTAIVGTVSGGAIEWSAPNDPSGADWTGTVTGDSISSGWTDAAGGTGTLTLTRTSGTAPSVNTTGAWSGTYNFTDQCSNGVKVSYTGPMTVTLAQSGANAGGVVTMRNVPLYDQNCKVITNLTQSMSVAGSVAGSTLTGAVFDPSGAFDFPIGANVTSGAMSGTVNGASATNTAGTFTLTQSSTAPPAADLAGTYDGSYTETDNTISQCLNIGSLTYSGPATLTVNQAGTDVSGWLTFHNSESVSSDGFGNCVIVNSGDEVLPVYGTLASNVLTTVAPFAGLTLQLQLTFSGGSVTAQMQDSNGDVAAMTGSQSSTATPVAIISFTVAPAAVVPGQPATLTWSTANATAVSIDNNVGSQPVNGSVSVFPTQTTTYTLTATGASGTQSAKVTVTVFQPGPKRRIVKR